MDQSYYDKHKKLWNTIKHFPLYMWAHFYKNLRSVIFGFTWRRLRNQGPLLQGRWSIASFANPEHWSSLSKAETMYWKIGDVITVLQNSILVHFVKHCCSSQNIKMNHLTILYWVSSTLLPKSHVHLSCHNLRRPNV